MACCDGNYEGFEGLLSTWRILLLIVAYLGQFRRYFIKASERAIQVLVNFGESLGLATVLNIASKMSRVDF